MTHETAAHVKRIPARAPANGFSKVSGQRFRPRFQQRVPSKVQAKIPAPQFQQGIVVFFLACHNFKKERNKTKPKENPEVCLHIGSSKVAKRFQQIQARLPTSQPGSLSKARNNLTRKTKSTPALVRKMFQPELPARGFQQGSMLGSSSGFPEHAFCWHHSPAQRLKPNRIAVGN